MGLKWPTQHAVDITSGGCACQLAGLKNKAFQESPRRRSAGTLFPRTTSKAFHCYFSLSLKNDLSIFIFGCTESLLLHTGFL